MRMFNRSVILGLVFASMASAQAVTSTQHVDAPFSGVFSSGCSEDVAVSGFVHGIIHLTRSDDDNTIVSHSQVGPRNDVRAIGLSTGAQYNVTGSTHTRVQFSPNVLQNFTYNNTFKVVGLYTVHYNFHLLYGDDVNAPKASVDNFRVTCD